MSLKQVSLSKKDLDVLWREYKEDGNTEAKDAIVVHYLSVVKYVAGRIAMNSPSHIEEDDLIGWGILGLLDAAEKFDPAQKVSFEVYASTRIRGAILDHIRSLDWAPRSLRKKARRLKEAHAELREELEREPTDGEVAVRLNLSEDDLFQLKTEIFGAYIISLDGTISGGEGEGDTTVAEITSGATIPSPEDSAARREAEQQLAEAIQRLPEQERQVVILYYYDELTLKEIGQLLNLSESRICQIHRAVVKKLKRLLQIGLRDAYH
jgi:RNA polymerase sigma factor for flagellar operon FliA